MKDKIKSHFEGNYLLFFEKYVSNISKLKETEYRALCCFHDEKNPSFDFNIKNGRFFCHGCHEKGDIFSFFAKHKGLSINSDFQKILKGIAGDFGIQNGSAGTKIVKGAQGKKVILEYIYTDPDGKPRHKVARTESKEFYQSRYINGQWVKGIKGIDLVPYNLQAVIKADEIIIIEGEKDVDTLKTLGFVGTTNAMGAGCWKDSYNKHLKGKSVVLIPDNDEEGRKHMLNVAQSLDGQPKSLKWLELPGLQEKGDVSDFIDRFNDKDEAAESLALLIENAEPYKTKSPPKFEDAILTTQDFKKLDLPKRANFLSPWLKEKSISLISGWRGVGKTFFVLGVLDAITRNSNFGQWECETPVNCLYVDGEMTSEDMDERIDHLELNSEREKKLHIYSVAYASRLGLPRASLTDETWRDNLKAFMLDNDIRLFVADNIGSLAGGLDENVKKDW
ncbi:MAG: AAA family ATPase, partial [Deltaproteobacteria bacterium]|nr:AAA family ATPase [Deltaproteobacteria bacterium]